MKSPGRWIETIRPGAVSPPDIHLAIRQKRLAGSTPVAGTGSSTAPAGSMQSWKSVDGRTIEAQFAGLRVDQVTLVRGGKSFAVPLARLSPESQALARKLAGAPATQ